ncbi:MAG: site-specific integrase [Alphaproteobacteria bacterium]|nr:site-specific integrase [Desulfovibrionaceae bacterium]MBF0514542.1 site-specific integrase [Desulfovibrionaceae bacterium]MBF0563337.1 site-specific integrase [Alphaproteobacteria bacterium]
MPSICQKNGRNRWRGSVMVAGRVSRKWFPDTTKDSERAAATWEAEEKVRLIQEAASTTPMASWSLLQWANEVLAFALSRRAPATYTEKKGVFKRLLKAFGPDVALGDLDYDIAEEYLDGHAAERSGNAANKDRKNLAADWKWAQRKFRREGFPAGGNPWLEVERYSETRHPRYVPPMQDMVTVLANAQGQDHAMLTVILHLAARKDEVFRLTWEDIDFTRGKVRLKTRKTETGAWREDWLPMTRECRKACMAQWERRQPEQTAVFAQTGEYNMDEAYRGQPYSSRQHYMRKACVRSGVKPFGFHAIRHLAAGALFEAGYPVSTIQKVLRHQSPTTTVVYLRNHGYDVDQLELALEDALGKMPGKVIPLTTKNAPESDHSEAFCPQGLPPGIARRN